MPKVAQQGAPASQAHGGQKEAGVQQDPVVQPDEAAEPAEQANSARQGESAQQDDGAREDDSARQDDGAREDDSARQDDGARAEAGAGPAGESSAEQPNTEDVARAGALPKRVPGQQPVISGFDSKPVTPAASQEPPTEPTSAADDDDTDASTFNAAPTVNEDEDADGLPALRRPRSSPTPPKDA
jgi:hypothetical protein